MTIARIVARAVVAAAAIATTSFRLSAHGIVTCSQMTAAANVMQREVDGLRLSARGSAGEANALARKNPRAARVKTADAQLFTQRANVEQDRVNGLRHNISHCTNAPQDSDSK